MNTIDVLKSRVEETADRLAATQQDRRRQNRSLLDILVRLEEKFAAQEQELAFYRDRVRPLEAANVQLSELMRRLLDMVDAGLDGADEADDPVCQATAKAAAMLKNDLVPVVLAGETSEPRYEDVDAAILAAEDAAEAVFEDVDAETLAGEAAAESIDADLPEPVRIAMTAADDMVEPNAADIRVLLQRVEAAAQRMAQEKGLGNRGDGAPQAMPITRPSASAA